MAVYLAIGVGLIAAGAAIAAAFLTRARRTELALRAELAAARSSATAGAQRVLTAARLATDMQLENEDLMHVLLDRVARSIRPDARFSGFLARLEGPEIVTVALAGATEDARTGAKSLIGERIPLGQTFGPELLAAGGVVAFEDLAGSEILAARPYAQARRTRSLIGTAFRVGSRTYLLFFTSERPLSAPFTVSDRVYVELIAEFFAQRLRFVEQRERLRFNAEHDMLTELPNRAALRRALRLESGALATGAMIVIDLDSFRETSQSLGYQTADAVLVEIAAALRRSAAPGESVARIGPDVFALFVPDAGREVGEMRAQQCAALFAEPFGTGDREGQERVRITASIGVALAPANAANFEELLSCAESAVDRAKEAGRDQVAWYAPGVEPPREGLRALRNDLSRALRESQLTLYYQPIVALVSGRAVGIEALVRWDHPSRGLLEPGAFLPFAERNGLIGDVDRWVLARAFADLSIVRETPDLVLFVNISPNGVRQAWFLAAVRERVRGDPALAARIGIEITENSPLQDPGRVNGALLQLRELGITTSIDDFGTGHSSLGRLKNSAASVLKIDRTLIGGLPASVYDVVLVESIVAMTRRLGITTVAEGVESEAQVRWLRGHGVEQAQGFALAGPMTLASCLAWVARSRRTRATPTTEGRIAKRGILRE